MYEECPPSPVPSFPSFSAALRFLPASRSPTQPVSPSAGKCSVTEKLTEGRGCRAVGRPSDAHSNGRRVLPGWILGLDALANTSCLPLQIYYRDASASRCIAPLGPFLLWSLMDAVSQRSARVFSLLRSARSAFGDGLFAVDADAPSLSIRKPCSLFSGGHSRNYLALQRRERPWRPFIKYPSPQTRLPVTVSSYRDVGSLSPRSSLEVMRHKDRIIVRRLSYQGRDGVLEDCVCFLYRCARTHRSAR